MAGARHRGSSRLLDHRLEDLVGVRLLLDVNSLNLIVRRNFGC